MTRTKARSGSYKRPRLRFQKTYSEIPVITPEGVANPGPKDGPAVLKTDTNFQKKKLKVVVACFKQYLHCGKHDQKDRNQNDLN